MLKNDDEFSKQLLARLLSDLSIWLPIEVYKKLPIILPYVVRDNSCRPKKDGDDEEWGTANSAGFLRDDNSLIKGVIRSFPVRSNISAYNGLALGNGFVACHIWGETSISGKRMISSRHFMLNSFIPNLVWLPTQLAKLTDRQNSYAQKIMQVMSHRIYEHVSMPTKISVLWKALPYPDDLQDFYVDLNNVNFFNVSDRWVRNRISGLTLEIGNIIAVNTAAADRKDNKVKSHRYLPTLRRLPADDRQKLNKWLIEYKTLLMHNF